MPRDPQASSASRKSGSRTYFIGDLHLDPSHVPAYHLALDFLAQVRDAKALYILGDLFEYWIGDDAGIPLYKDVLAALARLSSNGCTLTVMLGNRDFLLADRFAQVSGATLVRDDELLAIIDNEAVLLMHGDTLCVDDVSYQAFRKQVRDSNWQREFLSKSIEERVAYATHLRQQSQVHSSEKMAELMDVNVSQVRSRLAANHCTTLIHGHTHRPDIHTDEVDGCSRLVVGDWHPDHAQYVVKDETGYHLRRFEGSLV